MGVSHLWFLDSDVCCPSDTVPRLLAHNLPIVSGLYCRRSPPVGVPVMIRNGTWVTDYPQGKLIEVDYVGAGCLLISRYVLENMPPQEPGHHWFNWKVDKQGIDPPGECLSEDFTFCAHAKRSMGIKTFVDSSIMCEHVGLAKATYGQFGPATV